MRKLNKRLLVLIIGGLLANESTFANVFKGLPVPPVLEQNSIAPDNGYGEKDVEEWVNNFGESAFTISGKITLPVGVVLNDTNSISVILVNSTTMQEVNSAIVNSNGEYKIYFPDTKIGTKDYILKVVTNIGGEIKEYFVDFGTDKYISGINANSDGFMSSSDLSWIYDSYGNRLPSDLNTLSITQNTPDNVLNLDLNSVDNNKYKLSGKIKVASAFVNGEVYVEAVDKTTGKNYNTLVKAKSGDYYEFELKVLKTSADVVLKIVTNNYDTYQYQEMYYNFGSDHQQSSDDSVISTKNINYLETYQSSGIYVPDIDKTSYITLSDNVSLQTPIDTTVLGANDYKISGTITPKTDYDYTKTTLRVELIDAKNGSVLTQTNALCNETTKVCDYKLELGSLLNDIDGNSNGGYILKVEQKVIWQTPTTLFYDFGTDKSVNNNETFKVASDVNYINNTIPDVNYFLVNKDTKSNNINIDLNNYTPPKTYKISGTLTDVPASARYVNVTAYSPKKNIFTYLDVSKDGDNYKYNKDDLTEGVYIIKASYSAYDNDNIKQNYAFVLNDDNSDYNDNVSAVYEKDVFYAPFDINGNMLNYRVSGFDYSSVAYYAPDTNSIKMLNLNKDMSVPSLSLKPIEYYDYSVTLNTLTNIIGNKITLELSRTNSYERKIIQTTVTDATQTFTFEKVRANDDYNLAVDVERMKRLYFDVDNNKLSEDVYYLGYQNNSVCNDYKNGVFTCDETKDISWKLNLTTPFSVDNDNKSKTISFPTKNSISVALALGSNFANKDIVLYLSQYGGYTYVWENIKLDSNGAMTKELRLSPNKNYKVSLKIGQDWFVVNKNGSNYELLSENNAYSTVGEYKPLDTTMLDISAGDLAISGLNLPQLFTVTINFENLNKTDNTIDESILFSLASKTGTRWYSASNYDFDTHAYTNSAKVNLLAGDYNLKLQSNIGKSGMIDANGNDATNDTSIISSDVDFTTNAKFTWAKDKADTISISGDTTLNIKLKSLTSYKYISGIVNIGDGDVEKGWICAIKGDDGKCSEVNKNGTFKIESLSPSGDNNYFVEYWANSGENIRKIITMDNADNVTNATIELPVAQKITISGNLKNSTNEVKEIELLEVASDGSWKIVKSKSVNLATNFDYSFTDIAPAMEGYHYEIAVAIPVVNQTTGVATYTLYNAQKLDTTNGVANSISANSNVILTVQ